MTKFMWFLIGALTLFSTARLIHMHFWVRHLSKYKDTGGYLSRLAMLCRPPTKKDKEEKYWGDLNKALNEGLIFNVIGFLILTIIFFSNVKMP